MYYPVTALKHALRDLQKTKDFLTSRSFPQNISEEIDKVDLHISDLKESIKVLEKHESRIKDLSVEKQIIHRYRRGVLKPRLIEIYKISENLLERFIKKNELDI